MYNQVNHGPHTPMPPVYQQRPQVPPPPSHFPQVPPVPHVPTGVPPHIGLSAPHVFIHGPPTPSSTIPLNPSTQVPSSLVQNTGQSYGIARPSLHGNSMMPQTFPSFGQNSQHSSNLGVHTRHIQPPVPPSVPPPPLSHPQQELSWTPGPPLTGLPAPPPPLPPCPPQPGDVQSLQHIPPAPPAPSTSSFHSPTPDGVYLHSSVENYRVVSSTAPPLPSSPPPILPSPPPLASPKSSKPCSSELNTVDLSGSAPVPMDGGSNGEVAIANGDGLSATRNSILEYRWHDKKSASLLGPLAVDSSRPHDHLNVATEGDSAADSDMEMEDDITLSDKDQGLTHTIEALNQQHDLIVEDFSVKDQMPWMQNSTEEDPVKDLDGGVSSSGPLGASKECEGPKPSFGLAQINSSKPDSKDHTAMNDSVGVAQIPQCTTVSPLADDLTQTGTSYPSEASPHTDSGQLTRNGSPIRLLQDYASDDSSDNEDEACFADTSTLTVTTRAATSASVVHEDSGVFLKTDAGSKIPSTTEKGCELLSKASQNGSETFLHLVKQDKDTHRISVASGTNDASNEHNLENQFPENVDTSVETSKGKGVLSSAIIDHGSRIGNAQQEDEKRTSKFELNPLKVDKFGRLAKGGPTDSDSDDSQNHRSRRRNKRDRSWSRSQSPIERTSRRSRRSPRRRKDKRSWSRSWSPRNRRSRSGSRGRNRSRSRSPILRRSRKFNIENVRREKGQCFDFLQGRCYRGGSCRYVHHEPDRNASSKRYRNKHDLEVSSSSKTSRLHESMKKTSAKVSGDEFDVVRGQDVLLCQNIRSSSTDQDVEKRKDDSVRKAVVSTTSDYDGQTVNAASIKSESSRDPEVRGNFVAREDPSTNESFRKTMDCRQQPLVDGFPSNSINSSGDALKLSGGASQDVVPSENGSSVQQFQSNILVGVLEPSDQPSQHINASFVSDLSPDGDRLIDGAGKISTSKPLQYMFPATQQQSISSSVGEQLSAEQSSLCTQASKELPVHSSSVGFPLHSYQLPPPPALPHSYGENSVQPQLSRDNTIFPYQSMTREPYSAQSDTQNHHFSVPSNISWTTLPLPPPPPPPSLLVYNSSSNAAVPKSYVSSEFNENKSHLRSDCVSQISVRPGLPLNIQGSEYQDQAYPTMKEHSRPLMLTETFSSKPLLQGNMTCESRAGSNISKDDHYKQLSKHDSQFSSFSYFPNPHAHSKPFSWESDVNRQQLTSSYTLPPEEHLKSASLIHPFSPKQQPVYSLQYSASDGNMGVPGETGTVSRFPPDIMDSNHSASLTNFVGSKISAHFNPYASTFEKPLSSKFSSSMFRQEKDIIHVNHYGSSSSLQQTPVNGQGVFGVGSRQMVSSPKSARMVGQILPRSGNDQYDPLFDSIEPSSTSLKKFELDQKQEVTGESNVSLRPKSSYKSINVEENKEWEVGAVASTSSQNNDEYGETADAEVGAVENESLSNHVDVANMTTSEIEIDQVKSPGKKKKSKDSRSMKLFKVSIANFVKEVLKPSWRQGNMSKVAFKTIVKKTVDKVSGAMKGHRVPKSQAKINQYIDSSQRKLTKLVMGYVEKYVKV